VSRYTKGRRPACPVQGPNCLGELTDRGTRSCRPCYDYLRRQGLPQPPVSAVIVPERTPAPTPPDPPTLTEQVSESASRREITRITPEHVRTKEDLIRVCEIDEAEWDIIRWTCGAWQTVTKNADLKPEVTQLFKVQAWLAPRTVMRAIREELDALKADLIAGLHAQTSPLWAVQPSDPSDLAVVLAIPDLHVGKLAWGLETGHENYDVEIARRVFETALETLLDRAIGDRRVAEVIFPIGNDLLNADNIQGTTTSGTPQSTDGRYQRTFTVVRRMVTRAIERLRMVAPQVTVIAVPGNHDTLSAWHLADSLECYFHNAPGVTINNLPTQRKYHQFGENMWLFTHGNRGKKPDLPLVMATEQKAMFGRTTHREIHTGHLHKSWLDEFHGVKVRISPALCPPDAWHSEQQYVGNARSAEAYLYHRTQGLISQAFYTVQGDK